MHDAITDVAGIEVGHATDDGALTGCTAVVCRAGAIAGVAVRGAAPGTRETDLCRPGTLVERAHAVVLCGGSAFGLEAASGVSRELAAAGIGYDAGGIAVPIVPAAVIFDLAIGDTAWPDVAAGTAAAAAASTAAPDRGCVGAGTGATVGKVLGMEHATKSGTGTASVDAGGGTVVGALVVANAGGDVVDPATGAIVAGTRRPDDGSFADSVGLVRRGFEPPPPVQQTTLAVVATNAPLTVEQANHVASVAHDGLARTIRPVHTMHDGDTVFVLATGDDAGAGRLDSVAVTRLAVLAVDAVERATLDGVASATSAGGLPAARDLTSPEGAP
jgi:L-aminopeptidase/D-esterase-like protein